MKRKLKGILKIYEIKKNGKVNFLIELKNDGYTLYPDVYMKEEIPSMIKTHKVYILSEGREVINQIVLIKTLLENKLVELEVNGESVDCLKHILPLKSKNLIKLTINGKNYDPLRFKILKGKEIEYYGYDPLCGSLRYEGETDGLKVYCLDTNQYEIVIHKEYISNSCY